MRTGIFIRSCSADFDLLELCLAGIDQYARGFSRVVVVVLQSELENLRCRLTRLSYVGSRWDMFVFPINGRILELRGCVSLHPIGYIDQQFCKLQADDVMSDVDFILHLDSDMIPVAPFFADDLANDKTWYRCKLSNLDTNPTTGVPWGDGFRKLFNTELEYDYMRRAPFCIPRYLYRQAREFIFSKTGVSSLSSFAKSIPENIRLFSEFNLLGFVEHRYSAIRTQHFVEEIPFVNPAPEVPWLRICWSWGTTKEQAIEEVELFKHGVDVLTTTHSGKVATVHGDSHFRKWVEQNQRLDYDEPTFKLTLPLITPGSTIVEAGSNIGTHSVRYAQYGKLYAFEPHPVAFRALEFNLRNHPPLGQYEVYSLPMALGDSHGCVSLKMNQNAGASFVLPSFCGVSEFNAGVLVGRCPLDAFQLENVSLLHLDAEGSEYAILLGAIRTVEKCRPSIWIELNQITLARNNRTIQDVIRLLAAVRYEMIFRTPSPHVNDIQYDALFVPSEKATATATLLKLA